MAKKKVLTEKEQRVAVDILEDYIFSHKNKGFQSEFYTSIMERYQLMENPFTGLPCTSKEWAEDSLEYEKQVMMERFGHCDGLD